jgi:hypothetical protein
MNFGAISHWLKRNVDWFVAIIMWAIIARPFLSSAHSVYGFDTLAYSGPNLDSVFASWRQGKIPLWESGFFGGVPYLGRLGAQALYFPHVPLAFLGLNRAIEVSVALHLLALAAGMVLFIRHGLRLSAPASGVSTAIVMGSAYLSVKTLSFDQLVAISLLPWILFYVERTLRGGSRWTMTGLVISASLLILGGHPQYIYMEVIFIAIFVIGRLIDLRSLKPLKMLIAAGLLTIGVTALQLYATYSLTRSSAVSGKRPLETLSAPGYVADLPRLNLAIVGNAFHSSPISVAGSAEAVLGVGVLALLLSTIGFISFVRSSRLGFVLSMASAVVVGTLFAVGPQWWPFRSAYEVLPGIGTARVPGRWFVLSLFGIAFLAACGVHALSEQRITGRMRYVCLGGVVLTVGTLLAPKFLDVESSLRNWWILAALFVAVAVYTNIFDRHGPALVSIVVLLVLIEGGLAGNKGPAWNERSPVPLEQLGDDLFVSLKGQPGKIFSMTYDRMDNKEYLLTSLRPNTHLLTDLNSIDGYDGGMWVQERWVKAMETLSVADFNTDLTLRSQIQFPVNGDEVARFGVRWIITDTAVLPGESQFIGFVGPIIKEGTLEIWENSRWRGDSFVYVKTRQASSSESAARILKESESIRPDVGIVENPNLRLRCKSNCELRTLSVIYQTNDAGGLLFEIDRPGVLVIGQSWSLDWKVHVNGEQVQAFPVNVNMLGVSVPPGRSEVTYKYAPTWFQPLLVLSIFSLLLTLATGVLWGFCSNRQPEQVKEVPVDNS